MQRNNNEKKTQFCVQEKPEPLESLIPIPPVSIKCILCETATEFNAVRITEKYDFFCMYFPLHYGHTAYFFA